VPTSPQPAGTADTGGSPQVERVG